MKLLLKFVGKWRLWWSLCPECNSDAPGLDTCQVCNKRRSYDQPWPWTTSIKSNIWYNYKTLHKL